MIAINDKQMLFKDLNKQIDLSDFIIKYNDYFYLVLNPIVDVLIM